MHSLCYICFLALMILPALSTFSQNNLSADSLAYYQTKGKEFYSQGEKLFRSNLDSADQVLKIALSYLQRAEDWVSYMETLNGLAAVNYYRDDFQQYRKYALQAYEDAKSKFGETHRSYSLAANNLSNMYSTIGNYEKCQELLEESLRIKEFNQAPKLKIAYIYQNLGNNYYRTGDYIKALEYQKKALEYRLDTLATDDLDIATNYKVLGESFKELNQLDSALAFLNKSAAIVEQYKPSKGDRIFRRTILTWQGLAEVYTLKENYSLAEDYVRQTIRLQKGDEAFAKAYSYELLGRIYQDKKENGKALTAMNTALRLAKENDKFSSYPVIARKMIGIAELHLSNKNVDQALSFYQQALEVLAPGYVMNSQLDNPPAEELLAKLTSLRVLEGKAQALWTLYQEQSDTSFLTASLNTYMAATDLVRNIRKDILTPLARNNLAAQTSPIYTGAIEVAIACYQQSQELAYLEQAFQLAENNKALLLLESVNEQIARGFSNLPDNLQQQDDELRIDLAYYRKIVLEEKQKKGKANTEKIKEWEDHLFTLQKEYDQLEQKIEQTYPRYYQLKYENASPSLANLQQQVLQSDQALLEYSISTDQIYLFVLTANAPVQLYTINRTTETLEAIERINEFLRTPPSSGLSATVYQSFTQTAHQLYTQLLQPALAQLPTTINRLIIIPDQQLATLPFDLLLMEPAEGDKIDFSLNRLDYVLKNYQLSYSYSATLLGKNKEREAQAFKHDFIGFAPSFQPAMAEATRSCTSDNLYSLRCNGPEVETISQMLGGEGRYAAEAGKKQFEEEAGDYRIVHFASHACVDVDNPMFSKIYLTDDYLSMYDLYNSGLRSELAVLSACNTGSGKLLKGEGVMSLARGFITSGCRSTLMSLWSVDDCATSDIMTNYYIHLKSGENKAASLQRAKLDFLESTSRVQKHPYYWAAFVQFGDVQPMAFGGRAWRNWMLGFAGIALLLLFFQFRKRSAA